jgi:hypothetical protein
MDQGVAGVGGDDFGAAGGGGRIGSARRERGGEVA